MLLSSTHVENKVKYGYFDNENREYVITRPDTPLPWYNYIQNDEYSGLISHTGGGPSFHRDPRHRRLLRYRYNNIPADRPGRYVYLRDEESGDYWSATWAPVEKPVESVKFECRVGLNYQVIRSEYSGIATEITYFVTPKHNVEIWRLKVKNVSGRKRMLKTTSYAELCMWGTMRDVVNMDNNPRCSRLDWDDDTLIHSSWNDLGASLGTMSWVRTYGYFTSSTPPDGYDTDREMFIGPYRSEANPVVVETGKPNNHCENGGLPVAALCHDVILEDGEERIIAYQMSVADSPDDFDETIPIYRDLANVDAALDEVKSGWGGFLENLQVKTLDEDFDTMTNIWNPYQVIVTGLQSRSFCSWKWGHTVGMGFRDTSQDMMGCCHLRPDLARRKLRMLMSILRADGTATHGYSPLTDEGSDTDFLDDHLWLIISTCNYVKETGDLSLLDEKIRFMNGGEGTGYEHLDRAIEATMARRGANGLPQTGNADWNDGLNPGEPESESVFIAMLFCYAAKELAELADFLGKADAAVRYREYCDEMKKLTNEHAWDGAW